MKGLNMRIRWLVALVVLLLVRGIAPAAAEPAMWVVKDADSTLYLLGTFHAVKPGTPWRTEKMNAAFVASSDLWIEASEDGNELAIQALVMKHGMDLKHPLSTKISPETKVKLDQAAIDAGLKPSVLEPMRPWTAALAITVTPLLRAGYDPQQGVDKVLEADAKATQKPVHTFETPEQQILFFANLPPDTEIAMLTQTIEEAAKAPDMVERMAGAWLAGDIEALDALSFGPMKEGAPALYDTLIVQRNKAWTERIAILMQGAGTTFIAVGAGHLTGPHSLQTLLQARGFEVERY
jgi:uncharacterized protein